MTDEINYMHPQEFIEGGYLHEVNRLLLHPLGLALQVDPHPIKGKFEAAVWDYRDDPEGVLFGDDLLSAEKAVKVAQQMFSKRETRKKSTGFVVQPVDTDAPTLTTTYLDQSSRTSRPRTEYFEGVGDVEFEGFER